MIAVGFCALIGLMIVQHCKATDRISTPTSDQLKSLDFLSLTCHVSPAATLHWNTPPEGFDSDDKHKKKMHRKKWNGENISIAVRVTN